MLKLPPGQGFSIYSLAALLPLLPAKQRVTDPNDWMTSDAEVACPDPNCPTRFRITRTGRRYFGARTSPRTVPRAGFPVIPRSRLSDGYSISRIIKGGWHLAGDHGVVDPDRAMQRHGEFVEAGITTFDCADIYTGVEELIGAFRRAYPSLAPLVRCIPSSFRPVRSAVARPPLSNPSSIARCAGSASSVSTWCSSIGGISMPRYVETAFELDRLAPCRQDRAPRRDELRHGPARRAHRGGYSDRRAPAAILARRRPPRRLDGRIVPRPRDRLLCYGTVCGGFLSERWLGPADAPNRRSRTAP